MRVFDFENSKKQWRETDLDFYEPKRLTMFWESWNNCRIWKSPAIFRLLRSPKVLEECFPQIYDLFGEDFSNANSDWPQLRTSGDSGTLRLKMHKENRVKTKRAYTPKYPKPKEEGWWVVLGIQVPLTSKNFVLSLRKKKTWFSGNWRTPCFEKNQLRRLCQHQFKLRAQSAFSSHLGRKQTGNFWNQFSSATRRIVAL